jgi:hypothetical protein
VLGGVQTIESRFSLVEVMLSWYVGCEFFWGQGITFICYIFICLSASTGFGLRFEEFSLFISLLCFSFEVGDGDGPFEHGAHFFLKLLKVMINGRFCFPSNILALVKRWQIAVLEVVLGKHPVVFDELLDLLDFLESAFGENFKLTLEFIVNEQQLFVFSLRVLQSLDVSSFPLKQSLNLINKESILVLKVSILVPERGFHHLDEIGLFLSGNVVSGTTEAHAIAVGHGWVDVDLLPRLTRRALDHRAFEGGLKTLSAGEFRRRQPMGLFHGIFLFGRLGDVDKLRHEYLCILNNSIQPLSLCPLIILPSNCHFRWPHSSPPANNQANIFPSESFVLSISIIKKTMISKISSDFFFFLKADAGVRFILACLFVESLEYLVGVCVDIEVHFLVVVFEQVGGVSAQHFVDLFVWFQVAWLARNDVDNEVFEGALGSAVLDVDGGGIASVEALHGSGEDAQGEGDIEDLDGFELGELWDLPFGDKEYICMVDQVRPSRSCTMGIRA